MKRTTGRVVSVVVALLLAAAAFATWSSSPAAALVPEPDNDPFYQPPAGFESKEPGTVLRSRPVTVVGAGIPLGVRSQQFLARSTDAKDQPVAVAGTLMIPATPYPGNRPLLSYQPAIDSLGDQCNPSYTLRTGIEKESALIGAALNKGWAVVVSDYQGPRDAFGAGPMEGHGVLDGIRAAERLPDTGLAGVNTPVGLWGYSGGALASSWAAELQPSYAPELAVRGVASGGTPADLEAAARLMNGGPGSGLMLAAIAGISREYTEILPLFNERGEALLEQIGDMCYAQASATFPFRRISEFTDSPDPLNEPVAQEVLDTVTLGHNAPTAPVYLYHSIADELVPYNSATALRDQYCSEGATVKFHTDLLSEHVILAVTGAPAALRFLGDRFAGRTAPNSC